MFKPKIAFGISYLLMLSLKRPLPSIWKAGKGMLLRGSSVSFFVGTQVYVCVTFHFERWDASFHVRVSVQLIAEEWSQPNSFIANWRCCLPSFHVIIMFFRSGCAVESLLTVTIGTDAESHTGKFRTASRWRMRVTQKDGCPRHNGN